RSMIIYSAAFLIALALSAETIGVWGRVVGAAAGSPSTGYSTHVRVATLGRTFIFLAAPAIGYLVDRGAEPSLIAHCGFVTFITVAVITSSSLRVGLSQYAITFNRLRFIRTTRQCDMPARKSPMVWP